MRAFFLLFLLSIFQASTCVAQIKNPPSTGGEEIPPDLDIEFPEPDTIPPTTPEQDSISWAQKIYDFAVIEPEFPGGSEGLMNWLKENLTYPDECRDICISGTVYVQFVVTNTGEIEQVKVIRGLHPAIDKETVQLIHRMPKWKPGEQVKGIPVNVRYTLPIRYAIS